MTKELLSLYIILCKMPDSTSINHISEDLFSILNEFSTISLEQLNATMSLMERVESKYVIRLADIGILMKNFLKDYYILSIKNNSIFTYDNIYMDTSDYLFYHQHENRLHQRMKVRSREYVDSENLAFFEVKEKEWKVIRKSRYPINVSESKTLTKENIAFYNGICQSLWLDWSNRNLTPSMRTRYKRITLCSKKSDERITIDFDVQVQDLRTENSKLINLWAFSIIETKSSRKHSKSHKIIESLCYEKAKWCSKYCLWLLYTQQIKETKKFKQTMKTIDKYNKPINKLEKDTSDKLEKLNNAIITEMELPKGIASIACAVNPSSTSKEKTNTQ